MQNELEKLFGCPVDMVRVRDNMNGLLKQRIQREGIYV
jgi:predicted nucleotidyltransferase